MARSAKKKPKSSKEFIPMERTRALLSEIWDHWRHTLGHTPDKAKETMTAVIKEMHKAEVAALKKTLPKKKAVKKSAKKMAIKKPNRVKKLVESKAK